MSRTLAYFYAFPFAVALFRLLPSPIVPHAATSTFLVVLIMGLWIALGVSCWLYDVSHRDSLRSFPVVPALVVELCALGALFVLWLLVSRSIASAPGYTYSIGEGQVATCRFGINSALHLWTMLCLLSGLTAVLHAIPVSIIKNIDQSQPSDHLDLVRLTESHDRERPRQDFLNIQSIRFPKPLDWAPYLILGIALYTCVLILLPFLLVFGLPAAAIAWVFFYARDRPENQVPSLGL